MISIVRRKYLPAGLILAALAAAGCSQEGDTRHSSAYDIAALQEDRKAKDEYFRQEGSPIPEDRRADFAGLRYYPPDTAFVFDLKLEKLPSPEPVSIKATRGEMRPMQRYGRFTFSVAGKPCTLTAYTSETNPGGIFVPFKDETNGTETYEVGRYIDLQVRPDDQYRLDFNQAYNPYCAYNPGYTCPMVPDENILPVAIRAGEILPADAAH